MFKSLRNNKIIPEEKKFLKITFNDDKCPECNTKNYTAITNDGGSLSYCLLCNKSFVRFKYIEESNLDYKKIKYENFFKTNETNKTSMFI
jgi:hypothetical protein